MTLTTPGTICLDQCDRRLDQLFGQFQRVANGGGGQQELGEGGQAALPIEGVGAGQGDPLAQHLINDDEAQVAEEFTPIGMVRQDPGVKHIGIGKQEA